MNSLWIRTNEVLFSSDPLLRVRSSMAMLAVLLMGGSVFVMAWLAHAGWSSPTAVTWWAITTMGGNIVMALMVRTGVTAHWSDPALTFPQILWAITASGFAYVIAGEAKGVVPGLVAVTMLFAALNLKAKQIIVVSLYAVGVYAIAVVSTIALQQQTSITLELIYSVVLLNMLLGCMLLSLRLYQLRMRLHAQRQELAQALQINQELASRDPLTGLLNRRHMLELMHLEQRRCLRGVRSMVLVQMDIDYFKNINDTYGHATGDLALKTFADVVRSNIRSSDVLSRWGGEEFVLLLSDAHVPSAMLRLEIVRQAVAEAVIAGAPPDLRMTVSMGLAEHISGETVEATLDRADKALYCAKRAGRNQLVQGVRDTAEHAVTGEAL